MISAAFLLVTVFAAVFAIMDPIGAVPIVIALTKSYSKKDRNIVVFKSILVAAGMIFGFMFVGEYIFTVLGISIFDFKVAGGILLFLVAFEMLQGHIPSTSITEKEKEESMEREEISVVPIGTPLLAGPGTITAAMIYFNQDNYGLTLRLVVVLGVALAVVVSYFILKYSLPLFDRLGRVGSLIITRIMGILLMSLAIDFIATGIISIVTSV
ncbi:MAG: MarC family protein [Candidatus Thermoplasmatota archaeon]|nr:MarC family protein [Candidatus Thermoplasmatota archaeon]